MRPTNNIFEVAQPILVQCHISIPPENVVGGIEMSHSTKMG